jgi:hypothetical protein
LLILLLYGLRELATGSSLRLLCAVPHEFVFSNEEFVLVTFHIGIFNARVGRAPKLSVLNGLDFLFDVFFSLLILLPVVLFDKRL